MIGFFRKEQQQKTLEIIEDDQFKMALKTSMSQKQLVLIFVNNAKDDAITNLHMIKQYYPEAKLLYQNIGIVGDATKYNNYNDNIPLTLINPQLSIWEGTVKLNEGSVKFRDGNSWSANWGGVDFPSGKADYYSEDITVKAGYYHLTINLTEKTYKFELINKD